MQAFFLSYYGWRQPDLERGIKKLGCMHKHPSLIFKFKKGCGINKID
jgi:hypothetical protein